MRKALSDITGETCLPDANYGEDYVGQGQKYYAKQYQERVLKNLKNRAEQLGLQLVKASTGECVSPLRGTKAQEAGQSPDAAMVFYQSFRAPQG